MSDGASGPLAARLAARGSPWQAPLAWLPSLDSTNRWLRDAARTGAAPWSAVVGEEQTAGRGRRGRTWRSPRGNLHLSLLVDRPAGLGPESVGLMALLTGTAVALAADEWGVRARLKWPNDVRLDGRKLGGILIEGLTVGGAARLVVGIGLNVNGALEDDAASAAISLRERLGRPVPLVEVAAAVLAQLATCYHSPDAAAPATIVANWRRRAEDWWGRPVRAQLPDGGVIEGILRDVASDGTLLIEEASGRQRSVVAGDVEALRLSRDGAHEDEA